MLTLPRIISQIVIPKLHQSTSKEYPLALFMYVAKISGAEVEISSYNCLAGKNPIKSKRFQDVEYLTTCFHQEFDLYKVLFA